MALKQMGFASLILNLGQSDEMKHRHYGSCQ